MKVLPMIDWLSITVDIENYDENMNSVLSKLEACKQTAKSYQSQGLSEKVLIELPDDITFQVLPNGHPNFAYILKNDHIEIKLAKVRSGNRQSFPMYIHFKSSFLWSSGPENCWNWFKEWISGWFAPIVSHKLNRVDLCCHTDFPIPYDLDYFKGRYNTDSLTRNYREANTLVFGSRGSGNVYARIYNKSQEIAKSQKIWFTDLWLEHGLETDKISNIEFELHRTFFKQLLIEDYIRVDTCEDLFYSLKSIWCYCSCEWLVMLKTRDSYRNDRAEVHPFWIQAQNAFNQYSGSGSIARKLQKQYKAANLVPSLVGYLSTYAALNNKQNLEEVLRDFAKESKNLLNARGKTFEIKVTEKRKLMGFKEGVMNE